MVKLTVDKILKERNVTRYYLAKNAGIQFQVIDKYYKNTVVRYDSYVLDRICKVLNCDISDIIKFEKD